MADDNGAAECVLVAKDVDVKDKTGGVLTSVVHLLTTMIGMGVLAMPVAMADLGWIAGSIVILLIYGISILAATLLTYCYEVDGVQHPRYFEAVGHILGKRMQTAAAWCQLLDFFLVNTAFTITAATSMQTIASLSCNLDPETVDNDSDTDGCFNERWVFTLIFGGVQAFIVQASNLQNSAWLSMVGAATAVVYPTIALGLCIARVASGDVFGTVGGNSYPTGSAKAFNVLNALGTMSFAFTFSVVLLEIQDTIKEPPKSQVTMKKASNIALTITCAFYVLLATFGYMALGSNTPGNVLTGFENPKWLLVLASTLVIINMVASYNIQAQISFLTIEGYLANLMGVRHPAEETALQAAAAVVASEADMLHAEGGGGEKGEGVKEDDLAGAHPTPTGHSVQSAHSALSGGSGKLPQGALSARSLRRRGVLPEPSAKSESAAPLWEASSFSQKSNEILYPVASLKDGEVSCIAGPWRMQSSLKCPNSSAVRGGSFTSQGGSLTSKGGAASHTAQGKAGMPSIVEEGKGGDVEGAGGTSRWKYVACTVGIRAGYVVLTTALAVVMPFFSQIAGLIGGLVFWPLTIFFPFLMYMAAYKTTKGFRTLLYAIMVFMFLLAMGAVIGSFRNIIVGWSSFCFAC